MPIKLVCFAVLIKLTLGFEHMRRDQSFIQLLQSLVSYVLLSGAILPLNMKRQNQRIFLLFLLYNFLVTSIPNALFLPTDSL